jgi:hypothetical protein
MENSTKAEKYEKMSLEQGKAPVGSEIVFF